MIRSRFLIPAAALALYAPVESEAAFVLERAFFDSRLNADVNNRADTRQFITEERSFGLGVSSDLRVTVSNSADSPYSGGTNTAAQSVLGTFDGISRIDADFKLSGTRAPTYDRDVRDGVRISTIVNELRLTVDFRVEDEPEARPDWRESGISFISTDPAFIGKSGSPVTILSFQEGGAVGGSALAPGAYSATTFWQFFSNSRGPGGNTDWIGTLSLDFGEAITAAPGFDEANPILPEDATAGGCAAIPGTFCFIGSTSGGWVDPPSADGFIFETTDGSTFTDILNFPQGFEDEFALYVDGALIGMFGPGQSFNFDSVADGGVSKFEIRGLSPLVDSEDPLAFPIQLAYSNNTASFTMTPSVIPVPGMVWLSALFTGLLLRFASRRTV